MRGFNCESPVTSHQSPVEVHGTRFGKEYVLGAAIVAAGIVVAVTTIFGWTRICAVLTGAELSLTVKKVGLPAGNLQHVELTVKNYSGSRVEVLGCNVGCSCEKVLEQPRFVDPGKSAVIKIVHTLNGPPRVDGVLLTSAKRCSSVGFCVKDEPVSESQPPDS